MLDEIRGIAEGAQLPCNSILLETAYPFTAGASSNCTIISALGAITTNGTPIVGRNYDFLSDFKKCNQLRIVAGKNKRFSFVGGTITMLGVEEGFNDAGLFIGDAAGNQKSCHHREVCLQDKSCSWSWRTAILLMQQLTSSVRSRNSLITLEPAICLLTKERLS